MSGQNYKLDPDLLEYLAESDSYFPVSTDGVSLQELRGCYDRMCEALAAPLPKGLVIRDVQLAGVGVRLYQPPAPPVAKVIYLHGGGWVLGGLESHHDVCAEICFSTGCDVLSVDYRLAPEHRHPAALEDCLAVFDTVRAGTQAPVILAGDSAGGYLSAMVAAKRPGEAQGMVLIYTSIDPQMRSDSVRRHAHAPALTSEDLAYYHGEYFQDASENPVDFDPSGFPPTVAYGVEFDPIHDDSSLIVDHIINGGGQARFVSEAGLFHGCLRARHRSVRAGAFFARVQEAIDDLARGR